MRLIDADDIEYFPLDEVFNHSVMIAFKERIDVMSTVELIRCKDCKYFCAEQVEEHTPYGFTNMHWACWCDKHTDYENQKYLEVNTDDFCSRAERKEE